MFFPLKDENPTKRFAYITLLLIILNCLIGAVYLVMGREFRQLMWFKFGAIPREITGSFDVEPKISWWPKTLAPYYTLITSQFLHGSFFHLLSNMIFLWIFGNNIEDTVGHGRFIIFYLLGGIAAALLHIVIASDSPSPMIGASGAVSAMLGAYILKFPRARVRTLLFIFIFVTIINVPAVAFIGIWFFINVLNSLFSRMSGVAWFAHVGGFIFGLAFIKVFEKREKKRKYRVY
jgi:membrane associated rhomboid family serine protease